jgi:hypothetical protein
MGGWICVCRVKIATTTDDDPGRRKGEGFPLFATLFPLVLQLLADVEERERSRSADWIQTALLGLGACNMRS